MDLLINELKFEYIKKKLSELCGGFSIIGGPCAVESEEQIFSVAESLSKRGVKIFRGGAFKPRTSPYTYQGMGKDGVYLLKEACEKYSMLSISELLDVRDIELFVNNIDIIQIGSRNMQNFPLLSEVGRTKKPVMLKRGFMSTIEEFMLAAEYILKEGNENLILCERGVRSFEPSTRNMLDISAIAIEKATCSAPVFVDLSHSLGRKDIVIPIAKAVKAVGADGIMVEVHNQPEYALSDKEQQLDIKQFDEIIKALGRI